MARWVRTISLLRRGGFNKFGWYWSLRTVQTQKAIGSPACRKMALAVCLLGMPTGAAKLRLVNGLCHTSWLPLPYLTSWQPAARRSSRKRRSNCGAIKPPPVPLHATH